MILKREALDLSDRLAALAVGHAREAEIRLRARALRLAVEKYHDQDPPLLCAGEYLRIWALARILYSEVTQEKLTPWLP